MNSTKKTARIAGLLYLIMGITGAYSMLYVPSRLMVPGDAAATARHVMDAELLLRFGIVSNLISQIFFIFLALTLYRLFRKTHQNLASLMVALVVAAVPVTFLNMLNQAAALLLLSGADYLAAFEPDQLHALMMFFLDLHNHGIFIAEVFWGLWLLPFGLLVFRSGFIPRILGILLIIGCAAYLVESFTALLFPQFRDTITPLLLLPLSVGEFSIILWLLIKGVTNEQPYREAVHG